MVMLVLFTGNIALLMGNVKINNLKLIAISILFSIGVFIILNVSVYLNISLLDYFSYIFLIISLILFFVIFYFIRNNNFKLALYSVLALFIISLTLFCSQTSLNYLEKILYSLCVFIILFVVYQLSKLLHHAKRQYAVIIGEYMCLFSILTLIFALTYNSTLNLDYSMFSPFLILTPTYQLIYVIIAIIAVLVIGVFINDSKGGNS
ncbi:MAG: peptide ABC transporter permease [Methanobrevibacter sp.]|uniref:peptide ABC transporter permease n=1 Tax=uncultured Methanobrevibacter sp. TaxID=253161 RepID=UPI001DD0CA09|nr:peptide ABC transporter permease [uncultured Methanobrevibacter sp.]MBE6492771.1 peptide ABC transporter permease [Methanobrevibacter sp.]